MNQQQIDKNKLENDSSSWTTNETMNELNNHNNKLSNENNFYFYGKKIHFKCI